MEQALEVLPESDKICRAILWNKSGQGGANSGDCQQNNSHFSVAPSQTGQLGHPL